MTSRPPDFCFGKDSNGLADALQCPSEEVGTGSSARSPPHSPAPPYPWLPGCCGAHAEGRHTHAGSDTAPAHTPALTRPAEEPS